MVWQAAHQAAADHRHPRQRLSQARADLADKPDGLLVAPADEHCTHRCQAAHDAQRQRPLDPAHQVERHRADQQQGQHQVEELVQKDRQRRPSQRHLLGQAQRHRPRPQHPNGDGHHLPGQHTQHVIGKDVAESADPFPGDPVRDQRPPVRSHHVPQQRHRQRRQHIPPVAPHDLRPRLKPAQIQDQPKGQ